MIQLSDDEMLLLEDTFEGVPDKLLIRELLRRGRFRQYEASTLFYTEMRNEDRYMDSVRHGLMHNVARQIKDDKEHRPRSCPSIQVKVRA